ncbi:hypothetical protein PROPHIGD54-2_82 [Mycobacterium phage prophiGD54-2]|nr:hypothetical protein PROPHIGD54-2_82 [Mycobacterium phage prophiGD54-2]
MNPLVIPLSLSLLGIILVSGFVPFPWVALLWIASGVNGYLLGQAFFE